MARNTHFACLKRISHSVSVGDGMFRWIEVKAQIKRVEMQLQSIPQVLRPPESDTQAGDICVSIAVWFVAFADTGAANVDWAYRPYSIAIVVAMASCLSRYKLFVVAIKSSMRVCRYREMKEREMENRINLGIHHSKIHSHTIFNDPLHDPFDFQTNR